MPDSAQYDAVADLYDLYAGATFDLAFLREEAATAKGPVLELMAGTGRVSVVLAGACSALACIDRSRRMLRRLTAKFGAAEFHPHAVCADVRCLPFRNQFELAMMPFHSFAELTDAADQQRTMVEVSGSLKNGGRFVCTLHNPRMRRAGLDGQTRLVGEFAAPGGGYVDLWVTGTVDSQTRIARSSQRYELYDSTGKLESERYQHIDFALIEHDEFAAMSASTGFRTLHLYGDYDRSRFDPDTSPYMIWVLQRIGTPADSPAAV